MPSRISPPEVGRERGCRGNPHTGPRFVANTTDPSRPSSAGPEIFDDVPAGAASAVTADPRPLRLAAWLFPAALVLCLLGYLAASVPGSWFPAATPKEWSAREMQLTRGEGGLVGNEWVITALDSAGIAIISLNTDLRATDFAAISWDVADFPEAAEAQLLWRNDYQPAKLQSVRLTSAYGRLRPAVILGNPDWAGRISGVALAIRGTLPQPVRIRGGVAKPMGALELLRDRFDEWRTFEPWSGTSINTLSGGADIQGLPLPALLAATILLAALVWYALARSRRLTSGLPAAIGLLFVVGWLLVDLRWTVNYAQQVGETAAKYAGKDSRERHLAAEDGPLFAFLEKARAKMPEPRARVFMVADATYFRGRGAYHLYPHNVYFEPVQNLMPSPSALRSGDYLVAYQRRGVQYNAAENKLRWDDGREVGADLLLVEPGAALFRIR